jgi:FkbM family methyltransferase
MIFKIIRDVTHSLVTNKHTYLFGMVLIRIMRRIKKMNVSAEEKMELVGNFMGNIKIMVDKNSYMGGSIFWTGFHHLNELLYIQKTLCPNMTFIDIGANQGEFTLFAANKLSNGKVISFEPVSKQLNYLKYNLKINNFKNVDLHEFGLSDKDETLPVYTSHNRELHGGIHEGLSSMFKSESRSEIEEHIIVKNFDKYFEAKGLKRLDFIKIDIEGAELFALNGMINHLKKFKPQILLEMNEATFNSAGYTSKDMFSFLSKLGYKPYRIFRGNLLEVQELNEFSRYDNYVFK